MQLNKLVKTAIFGQIIATDRMIKSDAPFGLSSKMGIGVRMKSGRASGRLAINISFIQFVKEVSIR